MTSQEPKARSQRALDATDAMPPGLRECVHEYGYAIVYACRKAGVSKPSAIHELVREIWDGARQPRQKRERLGTLDWLLLQSGAEVNAAGLIRMLANNNLVIINRQPTLAMIGASMKEVANFNLRVTKKEKHRRRLLAAIEAGAEEMLPQINRPVPAEMCGAA